MSSTVIKRQLEGVVVSAGTPKTRIVLVERTQVHPKYGKRFQTSRRYPSHDENNVYKLNDKVVIEETRPLSRTKRWRIIKKVS
jgi:small subunit ribosomal protein S17